MYWCWDSAGPIFSTSIALFYFVFPYLVVFCDAAVVFSVCLFLAVFSFRFLNLVSNIYLSDPLLRFFCLFFVVFLFEFWLVFCV